ncbi:MAG: hypothetical protein Q7P63_01120 [Verrucomicrobiota bacterium JB022]|nr:hypothetical protein [Verrucomicrobiota bacterium JB022]
MSAEDFVIAQINPRDVVAMTAEVYVGNGKTPETNSRYGLLGSSASLEYAPNSETKTKMVPVRGIKRPVGAHTTKIEPKYNVTSNELSQKIVNMVFFTDADYDFGSAGADNAQTGLSAVAGTAWDFDATSTGEAVKAGDCTDVLDASGKPVQAITAIVLAGVNSAYGAAGDSTTLAEGIDYRLDPLLGQIVWLKPIDDDVITPTITSETITSTSRNYMRKLKPNRKGFIERMCRIFWYDQDDESNWVMAHKDFLARFTVTSGFTADGEADAEPQVEITVLTDGYMLKRV